VVTACCGAIFACGSPEPESALILGGESNPLTLGPRSLTSAQERSLRQVITSAGELCGTISEVFLRDVVPGAEAWEVRCAADGSYSVMVADNGTPAIVRRCLEGAVGDSPCSGGRYQRYGGRQRPSGPLNPELGKLLEPMTTKDSKAD
jgi:hypothetical protein